MYFHPYEVDYPHVAYACLGGFVVLFGMFSLFLREKLYIGEACWAFLFGVIIGPYGANIFNPRGWGGGEANIATTNALTLEFTRVVLAVGVFAIGVELPKAYMARHWKSLFFLLVPVMTWGWFVSAGLIYALIPGLNFLSSLAVAACLTPTDPILAAAVVGGKYADKNVPAHIRHLLAAESGCNDGAAFPFLFIALYLIIDSPHIGQAIQEWFVTLWLYQVILGVIIGALIGFAFRYLMKFCQRHDLIDRHSYVAQYLSLALFTIGVTTLIGSDDLLAAFSCGTAFAWDGFFNKQTEESVFSSVIDLLFNIAAFIFVGAWIPFSSFRDEAINLTPWRLVVVAILVLLLRRLPVIVALYRFIPDIKTFREAAFTGHFGPIGVGAVFISTLAAETLHKSEPEKGSQTELLTNSIQPIVAFMVVCSIVIHGLSIPSFTFGRRVHTASRTWSRHAPPDWTNQAKLVDRGAADIVINRDPEVDVERGELPPDESLSEKKRPEEDSRSGSVTEVSVSGKHSSSKFKEEEDGDGMDLGEKGAELMDEQGECRLPPAGTIIEEWQEGNHLVIERSNGPGEDVEVEVIRDPHLHGTDERESHTFSGPPDVVHHHLDAALSRFRHSQHDVEKDVKKAAEKLQQHITRIHDEHVGSSSKTSDEGTEEDEEDEPDQGGWASDQSGSSPHDSISRAASSSPTADRKKRQGKLGKQKATAAMPGPSTAHRKRRRRNSMRKGLVGSTARVYHESTSSVSTPIPGIGPQRSESLRSGENSESDAGRRRGRLPRATERLGHGGGPSRSLPGSRPSTANSRPTTASSLRHNRLENLRMLDSRSREHSPSRSIRFADDGGGTGNRSGTSTPRMSVFQVESESPNDDGETKVT